MIAAPRSVTCLRVEKQKRVLIVQRRLLRRSRPWHRRSSVVIQCQGWQRVERAPAQEDVHSSVVLNRL